MVTSNSSSVTPTVRVIRSSSSYEGKQGPTYTGGVSAESCNATGLWLGKIEVAPGARTTAHHHEKHETAIYVLQGGADHWYGENLEHHVVAGPGDYIYIPAGIPHVAVNRSQTEPVVAVVARTDPNEQESVVMRPDLDASVPQQFS